MDELCDLFASQNLWCGEENTKRLLSSLDDSKRILREYLYIDEMNASSKVKIHLQNCLQRYKSYYDKLLMTKSFQYLRNMLYKFLHDVNMDNFNRLLLTYSIDSEILSAVGMLKYDIHPSTL